MTASYHVLMRLVCALHRFTFRFVSFFERFYRMRNAWQFVQWHFQMPNDLTTTITMEKIEMA